MVAATHRRGGASRLLDETYRRQVAGVLGPSVEACVEGLPPATYEASVPAGIVRHGSAEAMFSWFPMARAYAAERAGYDACVIGASTDPGLWEANSPRM